VNLPNVHHLRCSIVGPEPRKDLFLLAWLLNQPQGAELKGFTNHRWNGVTTLHFAHICRGIILHRLELPYLQHIIPADFITKYRLLCAFAQTYGRDDLVIKAVETGTVIDRTLATGNEEMNRTLWKCAGYEQPPGIEAMVKEMAAYDFCFRVKNR
jgi:dTDP-4-dehydrorhamnose reductase